jgi:hypothetical protein
VPNGSCKPRDGRLVRSGISGKPLPRPANVDTLLRLEARVREASLLLLAFPCLPRARPYSSAGRDALIRSCLLATPNRGQCCRRRGCWEPQLRFQNHGHACARLHHITCQDDGLLEPAPKRAACANSLQESSSNQGTHHQWKSLKMVASVGSPCPLSLGTRLSTPHLSRQYKLCHVDHSSLDLDLRQHRVPWLPRPPPPA